MQQLPYIEEKMRVQSGTLFLANAALDFLRSIYYELTDGVLFQRILHVVEEAKAYDCGRGYLDCARCKAHRDTCEPVL